MSLTSKQAWAQLVSTTDLDMDPVQIDKDKFTMGRAQGSDLCISANRLVSNRHCFIERDLQSSSVWLQDTSSNGTFVNRNKKIMHQKVKLFHGDEIHLVCCLKEPTSNVSFLFQDLAELRLEEQETSTEPSSDETADCTLPYDSTLNVSAVIDTKEEEEEKVRIVAETSTRDVKKPSLKRLITPVEEDNNERMRCKQQKTSNSLLTINSDTDTLPMSSLSSLSSSSSVVAHNVSIHPANDSNQSASSANQANVTLPVAFRLDDMIVENCPPRSRSPTPGTSSEVAPDKENNKKEGKKGEMEELLLEEGTWKKGGKVEGEDTKKGGKEGAVENEKMKGKKEGAMEESLICTICQEIFHNCVSVQPCMHSFCAACYSDWMGISNECPTCRTAVERVSKNHIVNNLVEAFITENPDKKRPESELKVLDAKNKITVDMLALPARQPRGARGAWNAEQNDDDDDENDDDGRHGLESSAEAHSDDGDTDAASDRGDDPDYDPGLIGAFNTVPPAVFNNWAPGAAINWGLVRPPPTFCRQCPGYEATLKASRVPTPMEVKDDPGAGSSTAGSSTAAAQDGAGCSKDLPTVPAVPKYECTKNQIHVLCDCCQQAMPHRAAGTAPPQQCSLCQRFFCHKYWGCLRIGCAGCLGQFSEMKFPAAVLDGLLLDNKYESDVLKNYLESIGCTVDQFVDDCRTKMVVGRYFCRDGLALSRLHQYACYSCSRRNLAELAYQYRRDIPNDKLPVAVTSRADCYWGKNCRTQKNKPGHATTFNHICEQSRTM